MFYYLYQIAVITLFLIWIPRGLFCYLMKGKYRNVLFHRWGKSFPKREQESDYIIWCHAVSLGEVKAITPLIKKIHKIIPSARFIVTTVTSTGQEEAKQQLSFCAQIAYLPFDLPFIMQKTVQTVRPNLVLLSESDLWWNFLYYCRLQGAVIALVNGKISSRSYHRLKLCSWYARHLYQQLDIFCVQGALYQARFLSLNVPREKIYVTGNLKFDVQVSFLKEDQKLNLRHKLGILEEDPVIVVGSTHAEEEKLLLHSLLPLKKKLSRLKILIVPRHPERFESVRELFDQMELSYCVWSRLDHKPPEDIILIDAMGVLLSLYQIATVAFVGGSFIPGIGGHNLLEPLYYGTTLVFGPYMFSQPDIYEIVSSYHAGIQCDIRDVERVANRLLSQPQERLQLTKNGKNACAAFRGSVEATAQHLIPFLQKK